MSSGGTSTADKVMQFVGLGFQVVIIGLLIWLLVKAYECGIDNSKCPKAIYNIIRTGTKYDKYTDRVPSTLGDVIDDSKVKSANTCAKWCTQTYGCNGFTWQGDNCYNLSGDDPKLLTLIPASGTTYINADVDHPGAGFAARPAGEDFSISVSQRLGSALTNTNISACAKACIDKLTSNCIGFTMINDTNPTSNTCQLVSNVSNVMTNIGTQSYTWTTFSSSDYSDSKF
jgi:hypothetical protein